MESHRIQRMATMQVAKKAKKAGMSFDEFLDAIERGLASPTVLADAEALQERGELEHLMHWVWFPLNRYR